MNKVRVALKDRLDKIHIITAQPDTPLKSFLKEHYIPSDSIISYVNGKIVDDQSYVISKDDKIILDMVRAYQLPEYCKMLDLWELSDSEKNKLKSNNIYTKKILWFNDSGICDLVETPMNKKEFISYIDDMFVQGILEKKLITEGDKIVLALSGGRDSLALLYLLSRNKNRLPEHHIIGVTVEDTAASAKDVVVAKEAIHSLEVEDYSILPVNYINETWSFNHGFNHAIEKILSTKGRGYSITLWHSVMRACIERFSRDRDVLKIAFGYHFEDLLTSVFRCNTLGSLLGESVPKRTWGDFTHISPLWTITKKELTLYLKLIAPEHHSSQGSPTDYDRGDHNRDLNYFMTDLISGVWPGYGFNVFESFERLIKNYKIHQPNYDRCQNCGITYTNAYGGDVDTRKFKHVCFHCSYLIELDEIPLIHPVKTNVGQAQDV